MMNTVRRPRTLIPAAKRRGQRHENRLLLPGDARPGQPVATSVAPAAVGGICRLALSHRHFDAHAEMSDLPGGLRGVVQRDGDIDRERVDTPDVVIDVVYRHLAVSGGVAVAAVGFPARLKSFNHEWTRINTNFLCHRGAGSTEENCFLPQSR